jgi:hypothetical protein
VNIAPGAVRPVLRRDFTALQRHQLAHEGQTDAETTERTRGRGILLSEPIEYAREERRIDAGAAVGHGDCRLSPVRFHGELQRTGRAART